MLKDFWKLLKFLLTYKPKDVPKDVKNGLPMKNKTCREIVEAFSSYVVQTRQVRKAYDNQVSTLEAKVKELREKLLQCTKALKLVSSTCDRAFQLVPKWCLEAEK